MRAPNAFKISTFLNQNTAFDEVEEEDRKEGFQLRFQFFAVRRQHQAHPGEGCQGERAGRVHEVQHQPADEPGQLGGAGHE